MFHKPTRILEIVKEESEKLYEQYREPITLAGWCMGGVFTRMTAQAMPDKVRQVINMGTARTAVWYPKDLGLRPSRFRCSPRSSTPAPTG